MKFISGGFAVWQFSVASALQFTVPRHPISHCWDNTEKLHNYYFLLFWWLQQLQTTNQCPLSTTITICCCSINHHKPTTLCFHGNIFEYVVAWSFTYTLVSAQFLRKVPRFTFKYSYSQICGNLLSKLDALCHYDTVKPVYSGHPVSRSPSIIQPG